jgi:hypothetical protein
MSSRCPSPAPQSFSGAVRSVGLTALLAVCWGWGGPATAAEVEAGVRMTEFLKERKFEKGVRVSTKTTYPKEKRARARERWNKRLPSATDASWEFIEIAEKTYFGDNPETPAVRGPRITYASSDGSKRFEIDRKSGEVRFVFDTEKEWRAGCNLSLPQDGRKPRYGAGRKWNWPHFLVYQKLVDPAAPDGRIWLKNYPQLRMDFSAELVKSEKGKPDESPPGSWPNPRVRNHCLFYVVFCVMHKDPRVKLPNGSRRGRFVFALHPVFHSHDGKTHKPCGPWEGADPSEKSVYWTPIHAPLEVGRSKKVSIDALALARESVAALNQRYKARLAPDDYYVSQVLIGWEVWGAFRSEIRLRGLSLSGYKHKSQQTTSLYEYADPKNGNRSYQTRHNPKGFGNYRLIGSVGRTPALPLPGTVELHRYRHRRSGDCCHSTQCLPWGFPDYVYAGKVGHLFARRPSPEGLELHEYFAPRSKRHRLFTGRRPDRARGYQHRRSLGFLLKPRG